MVRTPEILPRPPGLAQLRPEGVDDGRLARPAWSGLEIGPRDLDRLRGLVDDVHPAGGRAVHLVDGDGLHRHLLGHLLREGPEVRDVGTRLLGLETLPEEAGHLVGGGALVDGTEVGDRDGGHVLLVVDDLDVPAAAVPAGRVEEHRDATAPELRDEGDGGAPLPIITAARAGDEGADLDVRRAGRGVAVLH